VYLEDSTMSEKTVPSHPRCVFVLLLAEEESLLLFMREVSAVA
jgi:hypothetical protein